MDCRSYVAVWAARPGIDTRDIATALCRTRMRRWPAGTNRRDCCARSRVARCTCLSYFRDNLHFFLGPREQAGMRSFLEQAADLGFVPRPWQVQLSATRGVMIDPTLEKRWRASASRWRKEWS